MACVACFDRRVSCKQVAALLRGHPRLSLLDMRMLYWRTDAHVDSSRDHQTHKGRIDCLHYCLRGEVRVPCTMHEARGTRRGRKADGARRVQRITSEQATACPSNV